MILAALLFAAAPARADVQIERLTLPHDAAPSSFAIGLPDGVNFCFDPVRGAVSYVWTGGFLDVAPARPGVGKFIGPAKLLGPVVYRESGVAPLRRGEPARESTVVFTGYTLLPGAIEFRYTVDHMPIRETVRVAPGGGSLLRRLQIDDRHDTRWWRVIDGQTAVELQRDTTGAATIELTFGSGSQ